MASAKTISINILLYGLLFVFFMVFFGVPSIIKYDKKETISVTTRKLTNGIEAPALTIVAIDLRNGYGWETKTSHTNSLDGRIMGTFLLDHCKEINQTDLEACVANDSFGLTDILRSATFGLFSKELNETAWSWDLFNSGYGRYFTWNPKRLITPDYLTGLVYMRGFTTFRFYVFVHDINFFVVNLNPFGPTKSFWEFDGNTEPNHYQQIYLVKHKKLNLDHRPCVEAKDYSFRKCVKESLARKVGCKRPWDKGNEQEICTTREQFKQFDLFYTKLQLKEVKEIEGTTGCLKSCMYNEFKIVNSVPKKALSLSGVPDGQIAIGLWAVSEYTEYEEEVLFFVHIQQTFVFVMSC